MKSFVTNSSQETMDLAKKLMHVIPDYIHVILLEGDLSAGKTTFTKGIALALGVKGVVNSPTFTILKRYQGTKTLNHLDLYRLHELGTDFDLEEYIDDANQFTVIEWPHQVDALLPTFFIQVKLTFIDENKRKIEISSHFEDTSWEDKL